MTDQMQTMLLLEDTRQTGSTEEMGREDFLEEVTFEPSHLRSEHPFSRRWKHVWFKAVFENRLLSDRLCYPPGGPRFSHLLQRSRLPNQPYTPAPLPMHSLTSSSIFVLPSLQEASRLHYLCPRTSALWLGRELL